MTKKNVIWSMEGSNVLALSYRSHTFKVHRNWSLSNFAWKEVQNKDDRPWKVDKILFIEKAPVKNMLKFWNEIYNVDHRIFNMDVKITKFLLDAIKYFVNNQILL